MPRNPYANEGVKPVTICLFDPLSPRDALKHHFKSLKTFLVFLQLGVLERKFPGNWFTNTCGNFL